MNVNTGHLIDFETYSEMLSAEEYTPVPKELQVAAEKKLAGKHEAVVSLTSGGKLSNWAKAQRRNKLAKQSRKRNRRRK